MTHKNVSDREITRRHYRTIVYYNFKVNMECIQLSISKIASTFSSVLLCFWNFIEITER